MNSIIEERRRQDEWRAKMKEELKKERERQKRHREKMSRLDDEYRSKYSANRRREFIYEFIVAGIVGILLGVAGGLLCLAIKAQGQ